MGLKAAIAMAKQAQKPLFIVAAASLKDVFKEVVALQLAAYEGRSIIRSLASDGA